MAEELEISISSQGDTDTASQVTVKSGLLAQAGKPLIVRARVCNADTFANSTNATVAPASNGGSTLKSHTSTKDIEVTSPVAVAATGTLTLTGVVIDGETVTMGNAVYEFDTDGVTTQGNRAVDISASATASQGTLSMATNPTADDTVTIGAVEYTFKAAQSLTTEIAIGEDAAETQANLVARVNGLDQFRGRKNALVSAGDFDSNDCILTARKPGAAGDLIATTETFTAVGNVFDAATLGTTTAGVNCTAANAITALVSKVTANVTSDVTAADGTGDTVDVAAVTAGTVGNSISTTETMANGSFSSTTLSGGVDSTPGQVTLAVTDGTAESVSLRFGPPELGGSEIDYTSATINITHEEA